MKEMMKEMVRTMMAEMMKETMKEMFSEMMGTPEVAKAEVETKPVAQTWSVDELLSMEEEETAKMVAKHNANLEPAKFIVEEFYPEYYNPKTHRYYTSKKLHKGLKYSKWLGNAVWAYNDLMIKQNYPGIKYSNGHYYSDDFSLFKTFASSYPIVENLSDEQYAVVKAHWEAKKNK